MADAQEPQPQTAPSDGIWVPALKEAGVAFAAAAVLLAIFYVSAFRWIHPEFVPFMDREATKLVALGKDLIPVSVGGYRVEDNSAIIEDFNGDEAILALPRSFQAEDYPFIKVNLEGFTRYSKFKILWRRVENPSQTHALEFNRSGDGATQIAMVYGNDNYRGKIADIALLFYDGPALGFENNNDVDIVINSVELRPFSTGQVAEQISQDWFNPPIWLGSSNNLVTGVHKTAVLHPNSVFTLTTGVAILLSLAKMVTCRYRQRTMSHTAVMRACVWVCVLGWLGSEALRWAWRIEVVQDSFSRYQNSYSGDNERYNPVLCARYPKTCSAPAFKDAGAKSAAQN